MNDWFCVSVLPRALRGTASVLAAQGQGQEHAPIQIPDSSIERPGDHGVAAHTNHLIRVGPNAVGTSPRGETPASIASVYGLTGQLAGAGVIVIVDAFHYPTALGDFNHFAQQFGLPQEPSTDPLNANNQVFQVIYANGKPRNNCGWAQEAALDIEWAHAMAPNAKIVLVESKTNSFANLFQAVEVASSIANGKEVSMSWGGASPRRGGQRFPSRASRGRVLRVERRHGRHEHLSRCLAERRVGRRYADQS